MRVTIAALAALALGGCATGAVERGAGAGAGAGPVEVKLIAFNDFHGNLEPPRQAVEAAGAGGEKVRVPAGGAAYLASAVAALKAENPNHLVVSAGDMVGASPLVSSLFLDEPTVHAMNLVGIDYHAVGNHEFDRGRAELLRLADGGCVQHTARTPCAVDPDFGGADFDLLAANVVTEAGRPLFAPYAIHSFRDGDREARLAIIGLTLKETATLVTPTGVAGLDFRDEAATVNALMPELRAQGVEAIVVLIHQGAISKAGHNEKSCDGLSGDLLPILARLDPEVDVVVSGHTHYSYICDYGQIDPARPFLVTSGGRYGTLLTDISLAIDPATNDVVERAADQLIVQSEAFSGAWGDVPLSDLYPRYPREPRVAALIERYREAARPLAARVVGRLAGPALEAPTAPGESALGTLIADAQLAATSAPDRGGAQIAFMNLSGVRADIVPAPDGSVTYGQLFEAQPFGNSLVVKSMTGRQIRALLEQQFASGWNTVDRPNMLAASRGLTYRFDLTRPEGERILDLRLDGAPVEPGRVYRVTMNSFLAAGGDNFTIFREGTDPLGGPQDIDALEAYIAAGAPPAR